MIDAGFCERTGFRGLHLACRERRIGVHVARMTGGHDAQQHHQPEGIAHGRAYFVAT